MTKHTLKVISANAMTIYRFEGQDTFLGTFCAAALISVNLESNTRLKVGVFHIYEAF